MKKFVLVAAAACALAVGGFAFGAIPGNDGVIHACYKNNGDLRVIDPSASKKDQANCKNDETALDWNQQGAQGEQGEQGPAWAPSYGVAQVIVQRGAAAPSVWGQYSTTLGSPVGDTTAGSFRFTCNNTTHVTCKVSVAAYTTASGYTVWPRILLHKQDFNSGGPSTYCEYGDGVTNNQPFGPVGTSATPLTLGVGGTLDCPGSTQSFPAGGTATTIDVPAGFYDVQASFTFLKP
jgi:hypothetical protein